MSQYGAQGYALHGWTYRAILAHYYSGTTLDPGHTTTVRVLLASARTSVTIGSDGSFSFAGQPLAAGSYRVTPGDGAITVTGNGTSTTASSPATFNPPTSGRLSLNGVAYRGELIVAVTSSGASLDVANQLALDAYISGVVPREMPARWHPEALKTQAVAARTYALATHGHCPWAGVEDAVFCPDTRDQVYGGSSAETTATNAAVQATAGEAVAYQDATGRSQLAITYFFSTSGGTSCAAADCWH